MLVAALSESGLTDDLDELVEKPRTPVVQQGTPQRVFVVNNGQTLVQQQPSPRMSVARVQTPTGVRHVQLMRASTGGSGVRQILVHPGQNVAQQAIQRMVVQQPTIINQTGAATQKFVRTPSGAIKVVKLVPRQSVSSPNVVQRTIRVTSPGQVADIQRQQLQSTAAASLGSSNRIVAPSPLRLAEVGKSGMAPATVAFRKAYMAASASQVPTPCLNAYGGSMCECQISVYHLSETTSLCRQCNEIAFQSFFPTNIYEHNLNVIILMLCLNENKLFKI